METSIGNVSEVEIRSLADIRRASECLQQRLSSVLNYRIAPWHDIASRVPMTDADGSVLLVDVFGWPNDPKNQWWSRNSRSALDIVSPIVAACRYESEPFWCNDEGIRTCRPNPFVSHLDLADFSSRSSLHAAIVVPVHLPFGQIGVASLSPKDPDVKDLALEFEKYGGAVSLYIRRFISTYVLVSSSVRNESMEAHRNLTRREIECLHWASLGKTNEDIMQILSLSLSTVRFHIGNAATKLSALNRGQAITRAARLGYIRFRI